LEPDVKKSFESGDGNELSEKAGKLPKMQAVHSSSALSINIFQHWRKVNQVPNIAAACGLCNKGNKNPQRVLFEAKFPINTHFPFSPNIDVVIENDPKSKFKVYAIECKFSEAYSSYGHSGIDSKYLSFETIWKDIPNLHNFSTSINPKDNEFAHLHPAQLVKHILGLKREYGKNGFRLLYLWYDCLGYEGTNHRKEIEKFTKIAKADDIKFHSLSYQELIIKLSKEYRDSHREYINYISDRYL
jgi:hypothetical protein